jgi:hypothetical protein
MNATIQGLQVPAGATVHVKVEVTAQVNITPFVAMQKANVFVRMNISDLMGARAPDLHVSDRLCWSVPIVLTSPARGEVGRVGEILVDATTGEVMAGPEAVERISSNARQLVERSPL